MPGIQYILVIIFKTCLHFGLNSLYSHVKAFPLTFIFGVLIFPIPKYVLFSLMSQIVRLNLNMKICIKIVFVKLVTNIEIHTFNFRFVLYLYS